MSFIKESLEYMLDCSFVEKGGKQTSVSDKRISKND